MKQYRKYLLSLWLISFAFIPVFGQLIWQKTNSLEEFMVTDLQEHNDQLFACLHGAGVYKTEDEGETWIASGNGIASFFPRVLMSKGETLFVGTNGEGVFKSINDGLSWETASDENLNLDIWSMTVSENRIFAGTKQGIYYSDDEGNSWTKAELPKTRTHHSIIFSMVEKGNLIIAGSNQYVYLSEDRGITWSAKRLDTNLDIRTASVQGQLILLGTSGDGIFASSNGREWTNYRAGKSNVRSILVLSEESLLLGLSNIGVLKDSLPINTGFFTQPAIKSLTVYKDTYYAGTFEDGIYRYGLKLNPPEISTNQNNLKEARIYPNPTNEGLVFLAYKMDEPAEVTIQLYNSLGTLVAEVFQANQNNGQHQVEYNMSNLDGGTYFFSLQIGNEQITKQVVLVK